MLFMIILECSDRWQGVSLLTAESLLREKEKRLEGEKVEEDI
jgi:hypothetical protein